ncbi:Uncharacterised protein [Mycobacteroides abscessus subsp. bolletii]|nr:Uncharacterised protein [Mycobacteroides abscessus subsp. bolletii]
MVTGTDSRNPTGQSATESGTSYVDAAVQTTPNPVRPRKAKSTFQVTAIADTNAGLCRREIVFILSFEKMGQIYIRLKIEPNDRSEQVYVVSPHAPMDIPSTQI